MCKPSGAFRRWEGGRLLALKTLDGYVSAFACSCKQRDQRPQHNAIANANANRSQSQLRSR